METLRRAKSHAFLISTLEVSDQLHTTAAVLPSGGKAPLVSLNKRLSCHQNSSEQTVSDPAPAIQSVSL
jgi:hypothetical protein